MDKIHIGKVALQDISHSFKINTSAEVKSVNLNQTNPQKLLKQYKFASLLPILTVLTNIYYFYCYFSSAYLDNVLHKN